MWLIGEFQTLGKTKWIRHSGNLNDSYKASNFEILNICVNFKVGLYSTIGPKISNGIG